MVGVALPTGSEAVAVVVVVVVIVIVAVVVVVVVEMEAEVTLQAEGGTRAAPAGDYWLESDLEYPESVPNCPQL